MRPGQMTRTALGLGIGFWAGAVPFSNLAARRFSGVDLRRVGTGTVSGTALYQVAGFGPLAVAGLLDVAKGTIGPLLVGRRRPVAAALACGLAVAGHNWSPFLGGAGGRGISPAMGALAVVGWPGMALLLTGLPRCRAGRSNPATAGGNKHPDHQEPHRRPAPHVPLPCHRHPVFSLSIQRSTGLRKSPSTQTPRAYRVATAA
jgi:Glycerol-3-phosphate acyltransferase